MAKITKTGKTAKRSTASPAAASAPSIYDDSILRSLRRIMRAVDLHSRQLARQCNLTGPQLVCLRRLLAEDGKTHGELAEDVSLSQATVTGIVDRLEFQELVRRERCVEDRRAVRIHLTAKGRKVVGAAPSGLHEQFSSRLRALPEKEQAVIDGALRQIVSMMEANDIDAAPILDSSASLDAPPRQPTTT